MLEFKAVLLDFLAAARLQPSHRIEAWFIPTLSGEGIRLLVVSFWFWVEEKKGLSCRQGPPTNRGQYKSCREVSNHTLELHSRRNLRETSPMTIWELSSFGVRRSCWEMWVGALRSSFLWVTHTHTSLHISSFCRPQPADSLMSTMRRGFATRLKTS